MTSIDAEKPACPSVLLVIGSLHGGGAERVLSEMANYWIKNGWVVAIATWSDSRSDDFYPLHSGVERVLLSERFRPRSAFGKVQANVRRILAFRELLKKKQPEVVLSFIATSNVLTIIGALGLGVRIVISERTNPGRSARIGALWKMMRNATYRRAHKVVAQTTGAAGWLRDKCGVEATVIANPLRQLPHINEDRDNLILAVGRLTAEKGFDILLQAFAAIHNDCPDWHVTIIGTGPEKPSLQALCDTLQLANRVEIIEPTQNIEPWMSRAGLVVQPSRFEGFPNVVMEAMGMGAAVISANCDWGPADLIEDGINGRLVKVDDADGLASAMSDLISDREQRARLGLEATKVRQKFRQEKVMAEWEACLLDLPRV